MLDADLARRFHDGDDEAVSEVYRRFSGPVFTVCLSVLRNPELAAEAAQLTFVKAWRAADTFDASRELSSWLYAIARRAAIDVYRSEQRRRADVLDSEDLVVQLPPDLDRTFDAWEVRRAIDDLPAAEREVVRLAHLEQLTHAEIAERLDIPIGTVKSRSHRAYGLLAQALRHLVE